MLVWMNKKTTGKGWSEKDVGEYLNKLNIPKHTGLDGMYPQELRELAAVIARPLYSFLSIVATGSITWRKANATPNFKKSNMQPQVSFI